MITNKLFDEIRVGDSATTQRALTKRDVDMFAVISGDMNPTHLSDEYAQMLLERQKVSGHSMWGGALISSLLGNDLPGPGTVYRSQQLNFHGSIDLDDTVTVTVRVTGKRAEDRSVIFDCRVENQRGELIITGVAEVIAPSVKATGEGIDLEDLRYHARTVFSDLIARVRDWEPIAVASTHPCSETALRGTIDAAKESIIRPILVGPRDRIQRVADEHGIDISPYELIDTPHSHASAAEAVALCRGGAAEAIMKGSLHTDEFMSAILKKETGLRTAARISHVFIMDVPTYPRPLFVTDAAINIYPTLEDKYHIVQNAIDLAHSLGIEVPKVAILSAVETINPKIPSTMEAASLCKMADRGQITGAILDGPLAFDNAISKEAAMIKGIKSEVAGVADIFVVPDLEAGNMMAKQMQYLIDADAAGIVVGARVPVILTSRADTPKARLASCAVATAVAFARRTAAQSVKA
ncbi:MAG: bifunctional enoyl-CoA hydratase/phosphate acetyltransferase [Desulfofustis sp. PB-SRB1]|jgi:phosphate acetyltransferase|nr:bifunctional enoyl-CoA hydratase/phosphate acetyltransferase [Desulfofustis sp. PB-SRB1]MBM1001431.1 bifunctional enoyl-CoA hydratase/phosphate acetyltransferase [Desulfofustis sp. PB-SRB1]HBH29249.1 phosphate acetyltransferase [Desulfofustis sp.]